MGAIRTYKVKDVAKITSVSVRTLHYYDEIRLLTPSGRTAAGYRLYNDDDLLRLQQVLIGRSLGMPLEEIRQWLDDPNFDYAKSLRKQRSLLIERLTETSDMIAVIDRTLEALSGAPYDVDFETIFDGFHPGDYDEEAQARWGETAAYAQSAQRTKDYGESEWTAIKDELDNILSEAAAAMSADTPADSRRALTIAERHRLHICRWFYDLPPRAHVNLAGMWESDDRFRRNIDKHGEGLTRWLVAAVRAADRDGAAQFP